MSYSEEEAFDIATRNREKNDTEFLLEFDFKFSKRETATQSLGNSWAIQIKIHDEDHLWYKYSNDDFWKLSKIENRPMSCQVDGDDTEMYFLTDQGADFLVSEFLRDNI